MMLRKKSTAVSIITSKMFKSQLCWAYFISLINYHVDIYIGMFNWSKVLLSQSISDDHIFLETLIINLLYAPLCPHIED